MGNFNVTGVDGLSLHVYDWKPEGDVKAVIQIAHGMGEQASRYERFAKLLNKAGYAVCANDHRGHGLSIPDGKTPGHMADKDGWNKAVEDLHLINRDIANRYPNKKILLLGHSMGSFMTQDYMARYGETVSGVALSSTNGPPGFLAKVGQAITRIEKLRLGAEGHSPLLLAMTFKEFNKAFKPNRTEFDWLSRDEVEVDKYVADPLCGFECSVATWIGMLDALTKIASDAALSTMNKSMPVYIFSGTEDPVGEKTKGVKRLLAAYQKHGFTEVSHRFYEGGRHELLNEINRDAVTDDFINWADRVSA